MIFRWLLSSWPDWDACLKNCASLFHTIGRTFITISTKLPCLFDRFWRTFGDTDWRGTSITKLYLLHQYRISWSRVRYTNIDSCKLVSNFEFLEVSLSNTMEETLECGCVGISWEQERWNVDVYINVNNNNVGMWMCPYKLFKVFVFVRYTNIAPRIAWEHWKYTM